MCVKFFPPESRPVGKPIRWRAGKHRDAQRCWVMATSDELPSAPSRLDWEAQKLLNRAIAYSHEAAEEAKSINRKFAAIEHHLASVSALVREAVTRLDDTRPQHIPPVMPTARACEYVGYGTDLAAFRRWCSRWQVTQCSRGRYRTKDIDLAYEREGGLRHTPASLRSVWRRRRASPSA